MPTNETQRSATKSQCKIGTMFIQDIDRIDCAIFDPSQGITGCSWYVDVSATGTLDKNGFVYDFSDLKRLVKQALSSSIDHTLIIPVMSKQVQFQETSNGELWKFQAKSLLTGDQSNWQYKCPKGAVFPIRSNNVSVALIERECTRIIRHRLPDGISSVKVLLREEQANSSATFFRYTHGITDHKGLCQRLFHGHRSMIEVYFNNEKRSDLEEYVLSNILGKSIHISSTHQIAKQNQSDSSVSVSFQGKSGTYEALIPRERSITISKRTSVESISAHVYKILRKKIREPGVLKVTCYEGIGKGAITESEINR